jgi:hypothetical protein
MTQQPQRPTEVLAALPHRRPNRRSQKRAASTPPEGERVSGKAPPAQPTEPDPPRGREIVGTMVQAAAELAEIGLSVSARAFKEAVARLPRP